MIEVKEEHICDYCDRKFEDNVIIHFKVNRQEVHEEGVLDLHGIEFDLCPECIRCYNLSNLFHELQIKRREK